MSYQFCHDISYVMTIMASLIPISLWGCEAQWLCTLLVIVLVYSCTVCPLLMWCVIYLQAPEGAQVDRFVLHVKLMNSRTNLTLPGNSTLHDYLIGQENVVYEFAIQAVNSGGSGPISNFMAVFYCSTGEQTQHTLITQLLLIPECSNVCRVTTFNTMYFSHRPFTRCIV